MRPTTILKCIARKSEIANLIFFFGFYGQNFVMVSYLARLLCLIEFHRRQLSATYRMARKYQ